MKAKKRILVVAGGSGGHILPAVGFCQDLLEKYPQDVDITFVSTKRQTASALITPDFKPVFLKISKGPLGLSRLIGGSIYWILKIRPDKVVVFGGYLSVPFVMLAKLFGCSVLLHEQNVVPGRANQFLSGITDKIAITFDETRKYFKVRQEKEILCSFPLRKSLKMVDKREALDFFGLDPHRFTVFVLGGSQGAHRINEAFLEALALNKQLSKLQVIHVCGAGDFAFVQKAYQKLVLSSKVFAFLNEMHYAYSAADLVISRAGAGAVVEVMYFGVPAILIPYPFACGHQRDNARVLAQTGAAILLEEEKTSADTLNGLLDIFVGDSIRRKTMGRLMESAYADMGKKSLSEVVML